MGPRDDADGDGSDTGGSDTGGSDTGGGDTGGPDTDVDGGDTGGSDTSGSDTGGLRTRVADAVWERHANPYSGWSRVATLPFVMYGVYARRPRVVAGAVGFAVVNPVAFPPPDDADAWMTRVVLGERMYYRRREGRRPVDILNYVNGPITAYALYAAWRRQPVRTVVATALAMAAKFAFVAHVARFYARHRDDYPDDVPAFDRAGGGGADALGRDDPVGSRPRRGDAGEGGDGQ
jgi:hypothetical protein